MRNNLATALLALALSMALAGCSLGPIIQKAPPGARTQDSAPGPAFFTQTTDSGMRYAHNWVERPCFTIDLPGYDWQLKETTSDFIVFVRGDLKLKLYLADNRVIDFAVAGMRTEGALRAFVASELDFARPKFRTFNATPPRMKENAQGVWALWRWEGRDGLRAGVGKGTPTDQSHRIASLWVDPWVLNFDFAEDVSPTPSTAADQIPEILESLTFHPACFQRMDAGETWSEHISVRDAGTAAPSVAGSESW